MIIHKHIRNFATAVLLALAVLSVPMQFAHASIGTEELAVIRMDGSTDSAPGSTGTIQARQKSMAQRTCEARGYNWRSGQCADKHCRLTNGASFTDGEIYNDPAEPGGGTYWRCNGLTGQWEQILRVHTPAGNAPTTGTNAPAGPLAPQSPTVPVNTGTRAR